MQQKITVQDHNKLTTYSEDDKAIYSKTDTYISDQEIRDFGEINENIRENRKKAKSEMEFLGRIPLALYQSVRNSIREKITGGQHHAEVYLATPEGKYELDQLTLKAIYSTNDYKYVLGK